MMVQCRPCFLAASTTVKNNNRSSEVQRLGLLHNFSPFVHFGRTLHGGDCLGCVICCDQNLETHFSEGSYFVLDISLPVLPVSHRVDDYLEMAISFCILQFHLIVTLDM
ncbi:hypothetical protein C0J52_09138 [Blattella germanica]|nr:hypothetical protein C0J52_09138 [Blattella germanica]